MHEFALYYSSNLSSSHYIGTKADDTSEHSTTGPEVQSTTSVSKSSSRTTCSSGMESAEVMQCTVEEVNIEISEESDSAISQDATYQDLVAEEFVLDVEQRMIKENLFIEHEVRKIKPQT